jgi:hypothetical protein
VTFRLALALTIAIAALTVTLGSTGVATSADTTIATSRIAIATSSDFRADLVAHRTGSGPAPTATITLTTYRRIGNGWRRLSSTRLAGVFFWHTVTGPRALCSFELATSGHSHVTVQLLQSPALGCGHSQTFALEG